jgi:hypothetical protein
MMKKLKKSRTRGDGCVYSRIPREGQLETPACRNTFLKPASRALERASH